MAITTPHRLLTIGPAGGLAAAVAKALALNGACLAADGRCDGVLFDARDESAEVPFLDLDDAAFAAQALDATAERIAALQAALPRIDPPGSVILLCSDAYLGQWYGCAQAAASAAMIGVMRSIAMECGRDGVRANAIACPLGSLADDGALVADAAAMAAVLMAAPGLSGETVLLDGGANLRLRQARRR